MAALIQPFPQQSGTVTMLQTRPTSAGGMIPMPQSSTAQQYSSQQQRHSYYGNPNAMPNAQAVYRPAQGPIQPYAFTSTPSLNTNPSRPQQPNGLRTSPAMPSLPRTQSFDSSAHFNRASRQPPTTSTSSSSGDRYTFGSRDDSSLPTQASRKLPSNMQLQLQPQQPFSGSLQTPTFAQVASPRASPERYRRSVPRSSSSPTVPVTGQHQRMAPPQHMHAAASSMDSSDYAKLAAARNQISMARRNSAQGIVSADDMQLYRQSEDAKRIRRRSMPSMDYLNAMIPHAGAFKKPDEPKDKQKVAQPPNVLHSHRKSGSSDSASSVKKASRVSSVARNTNATAAPTASPASSAMATGSDSSVSAQTRKDFPQPVNIPSRGSSDAVNRAAPSSDSRPVAMDAAAEGKKKAGRAGSLSAGMSDAAFVANSAMAEADAAQRPRTMYGVPSHLESPAMRHLTAINQKGGSLRSKTSRLRRAFSFGSAANFRAAANETENGKGGVDGKGQKDASSDELYDAEQARIAQQQEEAGIGSSIYAGAKIFSGSTDNLSISSTASSASIMIRKMGHGMKKSTRSLVGLFRPKSSMDHSSEASQRDAGVNVQSEAAAATVSMVTAEAERDRVNVHRDVHSQMAGDTGFPRLERNSVDASQASIVSDGLSSAGTDNSRKSIAGGEKERAEALAAVRKGILKYTNGSRSPSQDRGRGLMELQGPPAISDSPASSAPSTPNDEAMGHKRSGSVAIGGEDYFVSALRLRQDKSGSSTPQGSMRRNATFSPRIVFYDTWPSQEYDRRGEIATCNRLTPMLAQQIKEELNSFKMEMEVHENSKIYTHFF